MKFRLQFAALLLVASCLPATAQKVPADSMTARVHSTTARSVVVPMPKPIARVNGAVLTDHDLLREMYAIFPYARQHNGGFPKEMEADIRKGALKMIEFEELVYQEALRLQRTVAPERLSKAERDFRKQFASDQQYREFLKLEMNGSESVMRTKIKRSLLIEDLLKADVDNKSSVTLAEEKSFYEKNPDRFKLPESFALQTITVLPPKNPTTEQLKQVRKRAEAALTQAKATKNYEEFGMLAEKISEDDYRVMMGDHKSVAPSDMPATVIQAARRLQPGQMSELIPVDQAFTIIRLNAHSEPRMQTFEEVKNGLRSEMTQAKTEKLRHDLDAGLRKNAKIEEL